MNKIRELLKNKKIILLVVIVILILFALLFIYLRKKNTNNKVPSSTTGISWNTLVPGKSTKDEVIQKLGTPINEKIDNEKTTSTFQSSSQTRNNEAIFINNSTGFLKEIVTLSDNKTTKGLINQYGQPTSTLYGADSYNGYDLYVYPDKGLAFLGNLETGSLLEIWYFIPTIIDSFISQWANNYTKELTPKF